MFVTCLLLLAYQLSCTSMATGKLRGQVLERAAGAGLVAVVVVVTVVEVGVGVGV